jgi:hypothetical protein
MDNVRVHTFMREESGKLNVGIYMDSAWGLGRSLDAMNTPEGLRALSHALRRAADETERNLT